jgi:hypothetical protein
MLQVRGSGALARFFGQRWGAGCSDEAGKRCHTGGVCERWRRVELTTGGRGVPMEQVFSPIGIFGVDVDWPSIPIGKSAA